MRWTGKKLKENEKKERMCKMVSSMAIENVIQRSCINLHMKGRNKKEIIEEMAGMFDRAGVLSSRQCSYRQSMSGKAKDLQESAAR